MTYIDKIERDADRKGAPRVDRYFNSDVVATIHCKVSCTTGCTYLLNQWLPTRYVDQRLYEWENPPLPLCPSHDFWFSGIPVLPNTVAWKQERPRLTLCHWHFA